MMLKRSVKHPSGSLLADLAGTGDWQEGRRFRSGSDAADVQAWVESLGL